MTEKHRNVSQTLGELKCMPPKTELKIGLTAAEDGQHKTSRFESKTANHIVLKEHVG